MSQILVVGLIVVALGVLVMLVILSRRGRSDVEAKPPRKDLKVLLEEVRSLREDINVLKANPKIGEAVTAALSDIHEVAAYGKHPYAVAVHPLPDDYEERELSSLLEEVRSLREDIDMLKVNPNIGEAVNSALTNFHETAAYGKHWYEVAVHPLPHHDERELSKLTKEVLSLRQDIDLLKNDPTIGKAVTEILQKARGSDV